MTLHKSLASAGSATRASAASIASGARGQETGPACGSVTAKRAEDAEGNSKWPACFLCEISALSAFLL